MINSRDGQPAKRKPASGPTLNVKHPPAQCDNHGCKLGGSTDGGWFPAKVKTGI